MAWGDAAHWAGDLETGKVYAFEGLALEEAKLKYMRANNWWQLQLHTECACVWNIVDNGLIPKIYFDFHHLNVLEKIDANQHVDIVGIILCMGQPIKGMTTVTDADSSTS
ncbi:hypothetical protein DACRYDRAFT_109206 [Dacryopinax primogenitus]|uniref:Uncharacterized protein n=1 Tax=Dacryopinax primogenitus (strain DJM 731) TaxID=1858805 RepID=M5G9K1_DACPD|nr:uncharacterized protein DACRYDRAFT_109206 [Dacryopinax primogenitus]EJU00488.1 hypothetical protein DACRYDRAFT_109206 [Dacryopinax primogenitus]